MLANKKMFCWNFSHVALTLELHFQFFKKAKAKGYGEHDQAAIYRAADL